MIGLEVLRRLTMTSSTQIGREPFVSTASALVRAGDRLYIAADDESSVAVFSAEDTQAPGNWIPLWDDKLPLDVKARKRAKADLEAAVLLPPPMFPPHGALLLLPSGSLQNRFRGMLLGLDRSGQLTGVKRPVDAQILFDALLAALKLRSPEMANGLKRLNIEGAALSGEDLWIFNRGNDEPSVNAVFVCNSATALRLLMGPLADIEGLVRSVRFPKLGEIDGVPLSFTDASALPNGQVVFTAAAEATKDAVEDGEVKGSVVGVFAKNGDLIGMKRLEGNYKIEGVDARLEGNELRFLFVHDADEPTRPSELLAGTLPWSEL